MKQENVAIWSFDCIAICAVMSLAFDSKRLRKLCRKYELIQQVKNPDDGYRLHCVHQACHEPGGALGRYLTKHFNDQFSMIIQAIRKEPGVDEEQVVDLFEKWNAMNPAGLIWALLTDSRTYFNKAGNYYVHRAMYVGLRKTRCAASASCQVECAYKKSSKKLERTQKTVVSQLDQIRDLKAGLQKSKEEIAALQGLCAQQTQASSAQEPPTSSSALLERQNRKMSYELKQLQRSNGMLKEALAFARDLASFNALEKDDTEPATCLCKKGSASCPAWNEKGCSLEALRIAVVGGLHRLEPKYKEAIEALGAECFFHGGDCHGGSSSLKNTVCRSDLVVFITRINSHCALQVVRALCKKTGKRFLAVRETGPQALVRALQNAA